MTAVPRRALPSAARARSRRRPYPAPRGPSQREGPLPERMPPANTLRAPRSRASRSAATARSSGQPAAGRPRVRWLRRSPSLRMGRAALNSTRSMPLAPATCQQSVRRRRRLHLCSSGATSCWRTLSGSRARRASARTALAELWRLQEPRRLRELRGHPGQEPAGGAVEAGRAPSQRDPGARALPAAATGRPPPSAKPPSAVGNYLATMGIPVGP
jgi:hypothetical protein